MAKTKIDVFIDTREFINLVTYQHKHGYNTMSKCVNKIIQDFFLENDQVKQVVNRLERVIQDQYAKIQTLEHDLRHKEIKKNDV